MGIIIAVEAAIGPRDREGPLSRKPLTCYSLFLYLTLLLYVSSLIYGTFIPFIVATFITFSVSCQYGGGGPISFAMVNMSSSYTSGFDH